MRRRSRKAGLRTIGQTGVLGMKSTDAGLCRLSPGEEIARRGVAKGQKLISKRPSLLSEARSHQAKSGRHTAGHRRGLLTALECIS